MYVCISKVWFLNSWLFYIAPAATAIHLCAFPQ